MAGSCRSGACPATFAGLNRKGKVGYLLNPLDAGAVEPVTIARIVMLTVFRGQPVGPRRRIAMPQTEAESALDEKQVPVMDDTHRRPLRVLTFILKCFKPSVEPFGAVVRNLGTKRSTSARISRASHRSCSAFFVVLRVCRDAWIAINAPNDMMRPGASNHFLSTVSRVRFA